MQITGILVAKTIIKFYKLTNQRTDSPLPPRKSATTTSRQTPKGRAASAANSSQALRALIPLPRTPGTKWGSEGTSGSAAQSSVHLTQCSRVDITLHLTTSSLEERKQLTYQTS